MQITVHLFASFRTGRFKQADRELPDGTSLAHLVAHLGIAEDELGMCLVNGRHVRLEQQLNEGDGIYLFPMLGGG